MQVGPFRDIFHHHSVAGISPVPFAFVDLGSALSGHVEPFILPLLPFTLPPLHCVATGSCPCDLPQLGGELPEVVLGEVLSQGQQS